MKAKNKLKAVKVTESQDNSVNRPMLSLELSRKILNKNGIEYTDEEILTIREFMYRVAEITTKHYQRVKEANSKVIPIIQTNQDETKSIPLRSGKYRRAS